MDKPIRIKVEQQQKPDLRKLARALLLIAEAEMTKEEAARSKRSKAS